MQDFDGGHVKGAINVPSEAFAESVDKFIETQLAGKEKVVVHCQLSQKRGPRCAALLQQRLAELGLPQSVVVMKGGFSTYGAMYGSDPALVATDDK
jgi:arsenical-resistance protein 2